MTVFKQPGPAAALSPVVSLRLKPVSGCHPKTLSSGLGSNQPSVDVGPFGFISHVQAQVERHHLVIEKEK